MDIFKKSIQDRWRGGIVAKDFAPVFDGTIGSDDGRCSLIATMDDF